MYTSDIEKQQYRSMLEHRRWQIADIDLVKYSKQRATTLKSDPSPAAADDHPLRRAARLSAMCVVVGERRREP